MKDTTSVDNVVRFPKEKLLTSLNTQTREDFIKQVVEYKTSFAMDLSEMLSGLIFGELSRAGVNFNDQHDILFPHMTLVSESIESLYMKASDVYHPLQHYAEDVFGDSEEEENVDKHDITVYDEPNINNGDD